MPDVKITECLVGKLNEVSHGNLNTGSALVKTILLFRAAKKLEFNIIITDVCPSKNGICLSKNWFERTI